jgi:hypothetical protein
MADTLQQLWDRGMTNPELKSLADVVTERMPNISVGEASYKPGNYGNTTFSFIKDPVIGIDRDQINQAKYPQYLANNILHHELIHALDDSMSKQATWDKQDTIEKQRFADAYSKLDPRKVLERRITSLEQQQKERPSTRQGRALSEAYDMLNDRNERGDLYRGTSDEMRAFATANALHPKETVFPAYYRDKEEGLTRGISHIDPTVATETAILQDLAERARKSKPKTKQDLFNSWASKYFAK